MHSKPGYQLRETFLSREKYATNIIKCNMSTTWQRHVGEKNMRGASGWIGNRISLSLSKVAR